LEEGSEKLKSVELVLEQTGVSTGAFGRAEKYEAKKEQIKEWLKDENPKVRSFAASYLKSPDYSITSETRRATEDIEMRKHAWGDEEE